MKAVYIIFLLLALCPGLALAQDAVPQDVDFEDFDTSYIYPIVMGTGSYKIDGRRLSMLTMPISITQQHVDDEEHEFGLKWYVPVTVGYDQIDDTDWLNQIFTQELVTVSVMPGAQFTIPLNDTWLIRPFGQAGIGQDFTSHETFLLASLGVRLLGTWKYEEGWELRWGAAARLAGEYQTKSYRTHSLSLLETGLDVRKDTGFTVMESRLNAGAYYRFQSYLPEWTLGEFRRDRSDIQEVHELGVSVGLIKPRKIFGVTVTRLRLGFKRGDNIKGWTVGTEFPF